MLRKVRWWIDSAFPTGDDEWDSYSKRSYTHLVREGAVYTLCGVRFYKEHETRPHRTLICKNCIRVRNGKKFEE